jgi:predicted alpha/beta superfamily hydrolase
MTRVRILFISAFLLLSGSSLYSQTKGSDSTTTPPEVSISGTQLLSINSSITNEKYDLYVNLPRDYGDTSKVFPVVYVLDGQWDFALVESLFGQEYFDGFVPSMVVVGITWSGANANYDSLRAGDFTPAPVMGTPQGGGAAKFLQFIKKELVPFVESKYRVEKTGRTLIGSSLGGLFTLYTMFNDPGLFDRYVLTSPAIQWDNGIIYKYEKEYAGRKDIPPARMFVGIGGYEELAPFQKFVDLMKSHHYPGFDLEATVLDGFGHSGAKAEGFSRGLQFVFKAKPVVLSKSELEQYAGSYEIGPGMNAKISIKDDLLVVQIPGQPDIILHARDENNFYRVGSFLFAHFKRDDKGKVTGVTVETFVGTFPARKLEK